MQCEAMPLRDVWLLQEAREHVHWWDSVFPHAALCVLAALSVCLSRAGAWLTGWSTRWDMLCNEGVWAGYSRASFSCRVWHLTGLGKQFF